MLLLRHTLLLLAVQLCAAAATPALVVNDASAAATNRIIASAAGSFVPGIFAQSDPATDQTALLANFGLLLPSWTALDRRIDELERRHPESLFKLMFIIRHGEGTHNVAERTYGTPAWEEYYSKLPEYFDAPLTPLGIQQSLALRSKIEEQRSTLGFPKQFPILTSPLSRAVNTTANVFPELTTLRPHHAAADDAARHLHNPISLEEIREGVSFHTCDHRRNVTELRSLYPFVDFGFIQNDGDVLWNSEESEDPQNLVDRIDRFFHWIFDDQKKAAAASSSSTDQIVLKRAPRFIRDARYFSIVVHGGTTYSTQKYLGHQRFAIANAGLIPILIKWDPENANPKYLFV